MNRLPVRFENLVQAAADPALAFGDRTPELKPTYSSVVEFLEKADIATVFESTRPDVLAGQTLKQMAPPKDDEECLLLGKALRLIYEDARVGNALVVAKAQVKSHTQERAEPSRPSAWRSKAMTLPREVVVPIWDTAELLAAAKKAWPEATDSPWREGMLRLEPISGHSAPQISRRGEAYATLTSPSLIGQLDLLRTGGSGAAFRSPWLGDIKLPPNACFAAWHLAQGASLTDAAAAKLSQILDSALSGSAEALLILERHWPLVRTKALGAVETTPAAKGSAGLRLLEALWFGEIQK